MDNNQNAHKAKYPIQTLEKALDVIEVLKNADGALGISDIDNSLGIGKSTIHRILDTLMAYNYIEKDDHDKTKNRLSWKFFEIGQIVPVQRNLFNLNADALKEICDKHGESVNMGIRSGNTVIVVSRVVPKTNLTANVPIGSHLPLYASSLGRILISGLSESECRKLLMSLNIEKQTPNTVTEIDELMALFEKTRQQGYAIDDQEVYVGISCIAMPIKNYKNETVAAVSVSGPSSRLSISKMMSIQKDLAIACKEISAYMGHGEK